jgi:transcriptional regulator with XRE-family HTH domain
MQDSSSKKPSVNDIVRRVRLASGVSQLNLALSLGVSQRHISFIESGRCRPSRDLIDHWMRQLNAPKSVRNAAMLSAGFSTESNTGQNALSSLEVYRRVTQVHDPFPGIVFGPDWRMLHLNAGASLLFSLIMPDFMSTLEDDCAGWDMIAGIAHEGGLLSRMVEPERFGQRLLAQLRIEQLSMPSISDRVDALEARLRLKTTNWREISDIEPGLSPSFLTPVGQLNFLTVQSTFSLPQDTGQATLRCNLWFPSDKATRDVFQA